MKEIFAILYTAYFNHYMFIFLGFFLKALFFVCLFLTIWNSHSFQKYLTAKSKSVLKATE